jgi:hypothetical protein
MLIKKVISYSNKSELQFHAQVKRFSEDEVLRAIKDCFFLCFPFVCDILGVGFTRRVLFI